jgi:hypothetical protein
MTVSVNATFRSKLGHALKDWAEEVAITADPELAEMPLLWVIDRNELRGYAPTSCPETDVPMRLARWAAALGLQPAEGPDLCFVSYVGKVDVWPVRISPGMAQNAVMGNSSPVRIAHT